MVASSSQQNNTLLSLCLQSALPSQHTHGHTIPLRHGSHSAPKQSTFKPLAKICKWIHTRTLSGSIKLFKETIIILVCVTQVNAALYCLLTSRQVCAESFFIQQMCFCSSVQAPKIGSSKHRAKRQLLHGASRTCTSALTSETYFY